MKPFIALAAVAAVALATAACQPRAVTTNPSAFAEVHSATGAAIGNLTFRTTETGVRITGTLTGLTQGTHGVHLHQVGQCDAPAFSGAGPHLNPANVQHGILNPMGVHAGDLPNISVNASSQARVDVTTSRTMMNELLDADGTAIVIHASADDQRTDPSGNSGARVACGVVR